MNTYKYTETKALKIVNSETYNFVFDKRTGFHARWGKTQEEDPVSGPCPEILDIEVTTSCKGGCAFCYKSNNPNGKNMSLDTFKGILDRMPDFLTQIAIGADYDGSANPDLWKMMEYARSKGIVPNLTIAHANQETAEKLAKYCGAVAVSRYSNKRICYDSIHRLVKLGMKQVNMHILASAETLDWIKETAEDLPGGSHPDPRLVGMNAMVILSLKQKGRGENFHTLPQEDFSAIVKSLMDRNIRFGMDSCSAHKFLESLKTSGLSVEKVNQLETLVEPCEASLFSSYVDVDGNYFPCSFAAGTDFGEGISVLEHKSFQEVWDNPRVENFRQKLLGCARHCPIYNV